MFRFAVSLSSTSDDERGTQRRMCRFSFSLILFSNDFPSSSSSSSSPASAAVNVWLSGPLTESLLDLDEIKSEHPSRFFFQIGVGTETARHREPLHFVDIFIR